MATKKVQLPCWVDPATKAFVEERAGKEGRDPGNLCAFLVEWSVKQLKAAGTSLALLELEVKPKVELKGGRKVGSL